jgi:hypothetical protein
MKSRADVTITKSIVGNKQNADKKKEFDPRANPIEPGPPTPDEPDFKDRPIRGSGFASTPGAGPNPTPPETKE